MAGLTLLLVGVARSAQAQSFDQYLSPDVPGYDRDRGAEILQRPRTGFEPLGVRAGDFIIRTQLDEAISYSTNVLGTRPSVGSWAVGTSPQININSDFGRNALGASFGLSDQHYLDQKQETHTDWNASAGGSYQIGTDQVTVAASESYQHELQTNLDSATLSKPLGYKVTDIRLRYDTSQEVMLKFEPNLEYIGYRFDPKNVDGGVIVNGGVSQKANDRDIYVAGLTTRYGPAPQRSLVFVLRVIDSQFIAALGGAPRPNSLGYEALVGADYAFSGNLQALLLVGYEFRQFSGGVYPTRSSPVTQATVIWTPSGLTTLTGRAVRTIEDSIGETTTGVTLTQGILNIDHEYQRNILLQGRATASFAKYGLASGTQTLYGLGASATYLINRNLRLTTAYDFTSLGGSNANAINAGNGNVILIQNNTLSTAGNYNSHTVTVTLRFAL